MSGLSSIQGREGLVLQVIAGVEFLMDVTQLLVGYMGVDLRGGDIGVAEEFLYQPEVDALRQEVGGI